MPKAFTLSIFINNNIQKQNIINLQNLFNIFTTQNGFFFIFNQYLYSCIAPKIRLI